MSRTKTRNSEGIRMLELLPVVVNGEIDEQTLNQRMCVKKAKKELKKYGVVTFEGDDGPESHQVYNDLKLWAESIVSYKIVGSRYHFSVVDITRSHNSDDFAEPIN